MRLPDTGFARASALGALILALGLAGCRRTISIAYVDNSILLEKANIFAQARDSLKTFEEGWKAQANILKDSVDNYMKVLSTKGQGISKAETERMQKEFQEHQNTLTRFVGANQKKAAELENNLMDPAIKRVNAFIQTYREKHGYSLILGTVAGGNILAADKTLDITDQLISDMNTELK